MWPNRYDSISYTLNIYIYFVSFSPLSSFSRFLPAVVASHLPCIAPRCDDVSFSPYTRSRCGFRWHFSFQAHTKLPSTPHPPPSFPTHTQFISTNCLSHVSSLCTKTVCTTALPYTGYTFNLLDTVFHPGTDKSLEIHYF